MKRIVSSSAHFIELFFCTVHKLFSMSNLFENYRKIPKISPGAYIFQRTFLRGLFLEGTYIFGGAYYRREICISKLAGLIIGGKFVPKFWNVQLVILGFWLEIRNKLITLKMRSSNTTAINFIRTKIWFV